jgi:hypothetical protein
MVFLICIDLELEARLLSVCCLVPLVDGSVIKKEVILLVEDGIGGG